MTSLKNTLFLFFVTLLFSCTTDSKNNKIVKSSISSAIYGNLLDGKKVLSYTLKNSNNVELSVINLGGIVVSINAPDKNGTFEDIALGYDSLQHYINYNPYFGALIGRYGNRIAKGEFSIADTVYELSTNDGPNHLHGGPMGFHNVFWNIEILSDSTNPSLKLTYLSKEGEEGYPGNLSIEVIYTLTENNEFKIDYNATTDKTTIVNLTQHTYFNLSGNAKRSILDHQLMLNADTFLPIDNTLIPTGELKSVANTPFDFTTPTTIGLRIKNNNEQIEKGLGYDHCWVLTNQNDSMKSAGSLYDSESGRFMEILTTEPAIQFYSGNFLNEKIIGKNGIPYKKHDGLCLETQHFPDAPNQPLFPSTLLSPGEKYTSSTMYIFSVKK